MRRRGGGGSRGASIENILARFQDYFRFMMHNSKKRIRSIEREKSKECLQSSQSVQRSQCLDRKAVKFIALQVSGNNLTIQ